MRRLYWILPVAATCLLALAYFVNRQTSSGDQENRYDETGFDSPDQFQRLYYELRTREGDDGPAYPPNYRISELEKAVALKKGGSAARPWVSRGPGNVGGRTRGLIVDPDDASGKTWFAGAVGGGIWKTTNAGQSWQNMTPDIPYLAIGWLAMAPSNHDVIYAGTGEGFGGVGSIVGDGIFKSTDHGITWEQVGSVAVDPDFQFVNRIIVDPSDANTLLAATNEGLFRSTDGASTFSEVFRAAGGDGRVQDIVSNPSDFNIQYMSVNSTGVYKSTDAGLSWNQVLGSVGSRIELAVAPSDPNWVYAAVESGTSVLMVSQDAGATWSVVADQVEEPDWLGTQGWYDNAIAVDPFDKESVFVGGISIWRIDLAEGQTTRKRVTGMDVSEVEPFLDMVSFTGNYLTGLGLGPDEEAVDLTEEDFVSVEIRWGPGRSQKAHRFTVPTGSTSGVPPNSYSYQDYVDVPFEVWDVTNNRQLMVSFRDQAGDGGFNLISNTDQGREYVFVNAIPYNASAPDPNIVRDGGQTQKLIYFMWFILEPGLDWSTVDIPTSKIRINYGEEAVRLSNSSQLTFGGLRPLHVDQHNLVIYNKDQGAGTFSILNANDGGVGVSLDNGTTWNQVVGGYVTTQFYGVDKKPGEDVYVGGTQDNGTWRSPINPTASSAWDGKLAGDGFETVWHSTNPSLVLASSQYNAIQKSTDGGNFFGPSVDGLTDVGSGTGGLFVTRIAKSRIDPDLVFTVGTSGVWRSDDFADSWTLSPVDIAQWNASNITDVTVSRANAQVVWAGARASSNGKVHVSTDGGLTFHPVTVLSNNYGLIGSIETHPTEEGTAYVLFSMAGVPKIVRTTDYGETWEDITGFVTGGGVSDNGFPDVAVYSLLVMPHNTDEIWAGTEIGLFVSEDNGETWSFADDGLPSVAIWDLKIVDDEVVAGTHGRGIWSVAIPELLTAPPPDLPVAPRLKNGFFSPIGALAMDLDLRSAFDSVQVRANDERVGSSGPTVPGDTTIQVPFNTTGSFVIQAVAYKDGKTFYSPSTSVEAAQVPPKQWSYENEFTSLSAARDFAGSGFSVNRINQWLATSNPYPLNAELTFTLSIPIVVSDVVSTFRWTDVALVQPGLPNFDYTQPGFRDYVIIEATRDGKTWLPLVDGYDARYDNRWLSLYPSGEAPNPELLVQHEIDLRDTFDAGEIIFIRFRLHSDDNANGWGWAIGDLFIQPGAPVANESESELPEDFALHANYPNPFNPSTSISFSLPLRSDVTVQIYDMNGRLVQTLVRGDFEAGTHTVRWDASQVASGTYIYRLMAGDHVESRKMLLIR